MLLSGKSQRDVGAVAVYISKDSGYVFLPFSHDLNITKKTHCPVGNSNMDDHFSYIIQGTCVKY